MSGWEPGGDTKPPPGWLTGLVVLALALAAIAYAVTR